MAAINGRDFQHTQTSDSILTSLSVLLGQENMCIAVEVSLLSCKRAEIYVIFDQLPVYGLHLWFTTHADVGQYFHYYITSLCVLPGQKKHGWIKKLAFCCYHMQKLRFTFLNLQSHHLGFLTSAYSLPEHQYYTCGLSGPDNVWFGAIMLPASVELNMYYMLHGVWKYFPVISGFEPPYWLAGGW